MHAGPRRDAIGSGRVVAVAERAYRLRHRDGFDLLVARGWINQAEADTGRRWVRLYQRARLIPDVHAAELERRGHDGGEMSDEHDADHDRMRATMRALPVVLRGAAADLGDGRLASGIDPRRLLRALGEALAATA